jgi:hypothetical protein
MDIARNVLSLDEVAKTVFRLGDFIKHNLSPQVLVKRGFPLYLVVWRVTATTIEAMVNEPDDEARNSMMRTWRKSILSELVNIEIIVSLHPIPHV